MRTITVLAGLAALALAACGQADDAEKTAGSKATAKAEAGLAPTLGEGPKPGLWRVTMQMPGMPAGAAPPPSEVCVTKAEFERPDAPMEDMRGMDCTHDAFHREGDAIVGRTVCTMGEGMRSESNMRITGDLSRRYTMEVRSSMTPAPQPERASTTMVMTAERLGDCPTSAQ